MTTSKLLYRPYNSEYSKNFPEKCSILLITVYFMVKEYSTQILKFKDKDPETF